MQQPVKIQATLKGYRAWAFRQLLDALEEPAADVAKRMLEQWIDEHQGVLKRYGITHEKFRKSERGAGKVVSIAGRGASSDRTDVG